MLERFLGRDPKSTLQKNQIEVVCPVCGAVQMEPRLVVTTLCRKCGEHLRIENRRVIASSQINPVPSAVYPAEPDKIQTTFAGHKLPEMGPAAAVPDRNLRTADAPLGFGDMMMGRHDAASKAEIKAAPPPPPVPSEEHVVPAAPAPSSPPSGAPLSMLHRMMEQGQYRQHYFKEVECFDCHNKFKVGRSAKSTSCPSCGAYICLEDYDINISSTTPIRTRGDVLVRKTASVTTSEILCRDLRVFGMVSGRIECSGELLMRCTGTVIGEVTCRKLIIEKGSDVHFLNIVNATCVEVRARIFANIHCTGSVTISPTGWVHGDVTAKSVSIEPGGQIDGAMNILRNTPSPLASIIAPHAPDQPLLPLADGNA